MAPPQLRFKRRPPTLFDYQAEDIEFVNYQHHAPIKAPVAV
jgi:thymidylate synthase